MKNLFLIPLILFYCISFAQLEVLSISSYKKTTNQKHRISAETIDTISLPFFDDFTKTNTGNLDTKKWLESGVYINNEYCQNPPNFKVASFDGADQYGNPYIFLPNTDDINLAINDFTDELTSKPIDLSNVSTTSNLLFSFFWQKGGLSKHHEPTIGDSLYVYFLDLDSNWVKVWPMTSEHLTSVRQAQTGEFYSEFISITDTNFLHKGFQFQFKTFGRATGPWDLWSVDYILLDTNRTSELIVDFGYSTTPSPILKEYSTMPYAHFKKDPTAYLNSSISTKVKSLSTEPNIVKDSTILIKELTTNKTLDSTYIDDTKIIQSLESYDISWSFTADKIKNGLDDTLTYAYLESSFQLSSSKNDTVISNNSTKQATLLGNYYAYDDGSAEGGIGIREYGLVAYKFDLKESDSLSAIAIYFPKIEVNMSNTSLNLRIWKSLEGVDNANKTELLYSLSTQLFYADSSLNKFYIYNIADENDPLILDKGTFYIGYEQPNSLYRLYVGLDENTNSIDKYYYLSDGEWNQDFLDEGIKGSVMIRPKFGYKAEPIVGISKTLKNIKKQNEYIVYPNPSNGIINIDGDFTKIIVTDLIGTTILESEETQIDLGTNPKGMYLLHIFNEKERITKKIILE